MPALSAATRKRAEQATLELPFRVPPQDWFTLQQAARAIGLGESATEKLYDQGQLTGHSHNAGSGLRDHKRVLRVSLVAYLLRTADYEDTHSLVDSLLSSFRHCPLSILELLAAGIAKLIEAKKFSPPPTVNFPRSASGK